MPSPNDIREVCQAGKDRDPGWYRIHRRLSIHITARLLDTPITLNQVSLGMMACAAIGAALCVSPNLGVNAAGWAFLYLSFLLDKVDGEMARFRGQQAVIGILLDRFHHRLVEPLLFLAVGVRAWRATGSVLPVLAALASMLAANIIEETQQLPAFIATKHARETRRWPASRRAPSPALQRVAAVMRTLKTFRMFITLLPLVALAMVVERLTGWPATTALLVTSAVALWVYVVFQAFHYAAGQLDADIETLERSLPELASREDAEPGRRVGTSAEPAPGAGRAPSDARSGAARVALALVGVLVAGRATAGTYYVDNTSASCSSTGPGTETQPYCTISAALAARGAAGNTILVKPGTYPETVTIPASGAPGAPLVLQAYGGVVTIDGAEAYTQSNQWTQYSGNVWLAKSVTWSPKQVFADGARLAASTASPSSLPTRTYSYVSGKGLYVNAGGGNPATHSTYVGRRANALVLSNRSWVTIQGFTITRTEDRTVSMSSNCTDVQFVGNTVTFSNKYGVYVSNCDRVRIASCVVTDHNNHGIMLTAGSTECVIEDNEGARNLLPGTRSANGLYMYGSPGNVIRRNRWHDNQDTGQHLQSGSDGNLSMNNISWNNGDHGYDHLGASGTIHFNDVAYGNFKDGFSIEGTSPNTHLTNCIAVNNGLTTNEFDLWVDSSSLPGLVSNDNLFWNATSQQPIKIVNTIYSTVAAYSAATGQDTRTLQLDPRFVGAATGNFHLLSGSPAIDNGNSTDPSWPATDLEGNPRVDDLAVENTGRGPVPYSDRGAYEFQPAGLPPVAALTATPSSGTAPLGVTLSAEGSYDPEGRALVTYTFEFGDGTSAGPQAGATASHTYAAGTWTARVTVADDQGLGGSATTTVVSNQPPVPALVVSPASGKAPLAVTADASGSSDPDGTVASYRFDFGDGTIVGPQAGATATHDYGSGTWQARVTVTDNRGASTTLATPVTVSVGAPNQPPTAALSLTPTLGPAPLDVTANASGSTDADGSIVSYRFDFGDGTVVGPQASSSAAHTYATGGTRTVSVTVTDNDGGTAGATASVTATTGNQPPDGVITAPTANTTVSAGQSVLFTGAGSDPDGNTPLTYAWDFGGGAPASALQNPGPIVFSVAGTYNVAFTVRDALGLADPTPDTRVVTVTAADTTVACDEIHWTVTGQTSVTFDWRGPASTIRFGLTPDYDRTVAAVTPSPLPWSSAGPFWEARLTGLAENTTYHYAIGNSADHTFRTPPARGASGFTVMAEGDIGDSQHYPPVAAVQSQVAGETPAFALCLGDLTYANVNGQVSVDRHFNDVMAWSRDAAYMPVWGNHEYETSADDFRNYKGRFDLPNPRTAPNTSPPNDGGEDWYWFDYGNARFIAYPEPTPSSSAWEDWFPRASALMDSAQADPAITFIVTVGHRPAYSSGNHPGEPKLKTYLDQLGAAHSKYVLNLNGHSHDYERSFPQSGVVHVTCGTGGSPLEQDSVGTCPWGGGCPPPAWSAFRALHRGSLRLRFSSTGIEGAFLCGPAGGTGSNPDDVTCDPGTVLDAFSIGQPIVDHPPVVSAPARVSASEGGTVTVNVTAADPDGTALLGLSADLSRLPQGSDAVFTPAPDFASGVLTWHPTFADSGSYSVTFSAHDNLSGSAATAIQVDNVDRAPQVGTSVTSLSVNEQVPVTVGVTAADADGDAITSLVMSVTPAPPGNAPQFTTGNGNTTGTLSWVPSYADSGLYTFTFTAANALTDARSVTVQVANVDRAPALTVPPSLAASEGVPVTFSFTVADPDSDSIASLVADLHELPAVNDAVFTPGGNNRTATFTWTPTFGDSGIYNVVFTASNALVASASTTIHVGGTDRAPVITSPALVQATEGTPVSVGITAADPDSDVIASLTADLTGLPAGGGATFTPGSGNRTGLLTWTPGYADSGSYIVRWIAANALAETTVTTVHVNNTDRAPAVSAPAGVSQPYGSTFTVNVSASDPDGDAIAALTANLSPLPAGNTATFTAAPDQRSGVLSWTTSAGDTGTFAIVFTASNALGGQATSTLTVTHANQPPVAQLSVTPGTGNAPLVVSADASGSTDPDGTILSYRFDFGDGGTAGPQSSPIAGHTYGAGTWTCRVTVTDPFGAVGTTTVTVIAAAVGSGTNFVGNPSFESGTLGWNAYSSGTLLRVAGGFDGLSALQVTGPTSLSGFGINDSPNWVANSGTAGTRYRFSAWVRSATALGSAKVQVREYSGSTKVGSTFQSPGLQLSPTWQLVTADFVTQANGTTLDFQVFDQPVVNSEVFLVDNVSIYVVPPTQPALVAGSSADSTAALGGAEPAAADAGPALVFGASIMPTVTRADATLTFTTTRPGAVRVEMFDAAGRRVRSLFDQANVAPGVHRVPVDGRGDEGARLGSGLYFYRVQAAERTVTGRFVIVH